MKKICKSKTIVDNATNGRHLGLTTFYIKRNLFHAVLQNTHVVPFRSPSDVMQVRTLSAQMGLRSKLVDCF